MFALSIDPNFLALDTPPMMGVLVTDSPSSPSLDFMLRQSTVTLSRFLEAEILSSEQVTNSEGVALGIVTYQFGPSNEVELLASTFGKTAMFYFEGSLVTVTGSVNQALREELEPVFDTIFDTSNWLVHKTALGDWFNPPGRFNDQDSERGNHPK